MAPPPVISIENVVHDYQGLRPLRLRRFAVAASERVTLSGLDATAAEVLVNLVNGAILPDAGEVRVFGRSTADIGTQDEWLASLDRFGIVTARAVLLEAATVEQNLALPFTIEIDDIPDAARARVRELVSEVGLAADVLPRRTHELTPEERMRMHLARAVANAPDVLLLEHPTADVPRDRVPPFAGDVHRVVTSRGLTMLAMTEDDEFAGTVATARYRLQGGTGAVVDARGWRRWF